MVAWAIPAAVTAGSAIGSYLTGKSKSKKIADAQTIKQEAMLTPEQQKAMTALQQFYQTGKFGGYTAGEAYGGSLANYDMSSLESGGLEKLYAMLQQNPQDSLAGAKGTLGLGKAELEKLMTGTGYDPMAEGGLYSGFKRQALREQGESADRLKAQAAFGGRLSSGSTGKELGLLGERTGIALQDKLAELSDLYAQRKLGGIGTAMNMAGAESGIANLEQGMGMQQIAASQQYGGLQRMLEDAKAKDLYADWKRGHQELADVVGSAEKLAYSPVNWGVKEFTMPAVYENQQSPWSGFFNNMSGAGFNMLGQAYGSTL